MTQPPPPPPLPHAAELLRVHRFMAGFHRRRAARTLDFPGGFAALDDAYAHSRGDNHAMVTGPTDPEALPGRLDALLGHLPHRLAYVLDEELAGACRGPLEAAGYTTGSTYVMRHTGPVPAHGGAREVGLDALRAPVAASWRDLLPEVSAEVVDHLVERRAARLRAGDVRFLASCTEGTEGAEGGEPAAWADLYLDREEGIGQVEDLVASREHRGKGHAGRVLDTALHLAAEAGCGLRFLTAHTADWPHEWYRRRGFTAIGTVHVFERA
ncbi:GNAT family N-acetyltransferase [Streptomyces filamentosus]|uniref:GNAT family N-acetyltransferase n=1 Tax=Streptomyces filamentosus TaxID=67294 RepID=UPI001238F973|nr:GNAT family N-acetyltransferase [Streptomyces filamentosus]KAA6219323.1 GNAT family N-acetyltransferase [Streptomyces filamentosus]